MTGSRTRFAAGVALIAASFLVYPAYPLIVFLPLSDTTRVAATLAASLASWGAFTAGLFLAGEKGYAWLKSWWRR